MESSHFLAVSVFLDIWFRPPNAQNLLPKIGTKLHITRLVWQIDHRCLHLPGGFWGRPIQWYHAKCCGPALVAMTTKLRLKSPIIRLVRQIDRRCFGLTGVFRGWLIQWNHAKCCGADPCCHGNDIWARRGDPVAYRLVCIKACKYFKPCTLRTKHWLDDIMVRVFINV